MTIVTGAQDSWDRQLWNGVCSHYRGVISPHARVILERLNI